MDLTIARLFARARPYAAALVMALGVAACGSGAETASDGGGSSPAADIFPVTISAPGGDVRIEERPDRIVSLSPTATEMLFAIDAGDQVVAVDDNSNHPPEAPTTDLSGFEVNVEAVAGYEPDLIVYSNDPGGVRESFEKLGIPALMQPAAAGIEDTYTQIEQLGVATGHVGDATELVAGMQAEVEEIVGSVPEFDEAPTYFHELDNNYFTVTSKTFIGEVYSLLGLENIADAADKEGTGYPQLSAEYIIDADPDLIFLADTKCCNQSGATVAKRPGWDGIAAVESGGVVELDDDIASRWGPRVVDLLRIAAASIARVVTAKGAT